MRAAMTPTRTKMPRLLVMLLAEQIEGADRRHDEGAGDHGPAHVVRVLHQRPRIQHELPEAGELEGRRPSRS